MPHPAQQIALTEYLDAVENHASRIERLEKAILASCPAWRLLPVDVRQIAWNAQLRLCQRYRNLVVTAIARELAGFIWAIARAVPIAG